MDVGRQWIKSKWDLQHSPHQWARANGPMGATQMHLMEMGWELQLAQGRIRLRDNRGDIWQPNPQYGMGLLRNMLEEARETLLWLKAACTDMERGWKGGLI
eukprot:6549706-Karenia_brevis.AAC.1